MPTYDYKCEQHGYFVCIQAMSEHRWAQCPECHKISQQVVRTPPVLDIEAMARVGMPGAFEKSGDRVTKRHIQAGQDYVHPEKAAYYNSKQL